MENLLGTGLSIAILSGVVFGITNAIYSAMPFMSKLGDYTEIVKKVGAIIVALLLTFGFSIDLSQEILSVDPNAPYIGYILTGVVAGLGSAVVFTLGKQFKR